MSDIPRLGLGTWQNSDPRQCAESVQTALNHGYRHIDTAQTYGNEEAVGDGIAAADVEREDIFLATKVGRGNLGYDDVLRVAEESLDKLGVSYLDILYVHWPVQTYDPAETLPAMDELYDDEIIDRVGVSNFGPRHIEEAKDHLDAPIAANQVEMHPLFPQHELQAVAEANDHWLVAYAPLGRGEILSHPVMTSIAEEAGATPAQVCLSWELSHDRVAAIPKATSAAHIEENFASLELELTDKQIARIDAIEEESRVIDVDFGPWNE